MNISISTYKVKQTDTLESVAEQLGISAEALKRYHNTYCDLKNLIGNDLTGVYKILTPPREKIAELKENQKQIILNSNLPALHLAEDFYALNYEASERFEQWDKEDLVIDYSVSVNLREMADKGLLAEIKTSGFKKNGQSSDDKMSMLSLACMESISPIVFIVPAQGKIKGFYEHKTLIKKFENKRPDLETFFVGDISRIYFDQFHKSLTDETDLLKQFRSALLYQILFPEMDCFRRKKEWEESFYVVPNSFPLRCRFHTEHNFENPDDVEIIIKGKIEESCSLQELLKGVKFDALPEDKVTGEIELHYTTNKETKQLKKIDASIILLYREELYQKHSLILRAKEKEKPIRKFSTLIEE
ncbi:hypothetical protein QFZ37_003155 [Chryseobacterium ginsenosidimutans]|uniref:LysM peptidoglycan-binding domain-containing protein n=1 Tax=Chryseobacterium ginsenosidimutans TaxID=687846 RepID=UPI00277EA99E|nr:LysM domain-containing protein [Chryseobacterium ginsenosidimutans]MDQ0594786.1 hypothetical protein [Chryseobacterium ginsenosidimutans]